MLALIAAISENNCIGKNGEIPWHIPEDMKHQKEVTMGHVLLMGRKTWESIPEKFRPLNGRTNVVITSDPTYPVPAGVEVYTDIDQAIEAHSDETIFGYGGQRIYEALIDRAERLYITHVNQVVDGDAFFPTIDPTKWQITEREEHNGFSFTTYRRQ